ncbi:MAG: 1,3-beta-galactosyl-N-acetylhexosamine phosphorylase [Actinomycetaceae bacterium]|nr:1,3-beta-galactosyl-N-acetylhexosamine phosphorylase [Actinomycetaceae bacterium]MDU0969805.1 1,3-beta-galactosyl-N-acetylhexosamine phosphorylase [Actinomycetaceae bacterium]
MTAKGRVTLPVESGLGSLLQTYIDAFGADVVRDSDGTGLPDDVAQFGVGVYGTYFPGRGDQEFAARHLHACPQIFLSSQRTPAFSDGALRISIMQRYLPEQIVPNTQCDLAKYWQVIDRTTGDEIPVTSWHVTGEGADTMVVVDDAQAGHCYTAAFLAYQRWDPTQMYNYVTNNWDEDPTRTKEIPYDVRDEDVWQRMQQRFAQWLDDNPQVTTVRFTTFFYHFTLVFNADRREAYVDWFGYGASVSPAAIQAFEAATGFTCRPEDFICHGTFNSPFDPPTPLFRAWIDFQSAFVRQRVRTLTDMAHAAGRRAIMFLGDNWIGTEPYLPGFADTGLDGVVGSVGNALTCRMIAEIPGVAEHEGRFLPYFFPDVFNPEGDPVGEADAAWSSARRAILRKPLQRIGYGGYLSLAAQYPEFMERAGQICDEYRDLVDALDREPAAVLPCRVGVLSCWGQLRAWQNHMVAHAVPYPVAEPYVGVLESLAGLPLDVRFISFEDVRSGALDDLDVVVNCGLAGDAYSGGDEWADPQVVARLRQFIGRGGGFVGVGAPSAAPSRGLVFQLADVLGVDREGGRTLSIDRYARSSSDHFVVADGFDRLDGGPAGACVVIVDQDTVVLDGTPDRVRLSVRQSGEGRTVYLAGLPYTPHNARLLLRAIVWAAGAENDLAAAGLADDPRVDVAYLPGSGQVIASNSSRDRIETTLRSPQGAICVTLKPSRTLFVAPSLGGDATDVTKH